MSRAITAKTSLESLRKEAKRWLTAIRAGDREARQRFERAHLPAVATPGLRDIQHALAREFGQGSWTALRAELDDRRNDNPSDVERTNEFLDLSCLHYGVAPGSRSFSGYPDSPQRRQRAAGILLRHPEVARANLHAAVVSGERDEVKRVLAQRPESVRLKGGRELWEPLLFLCYGRLPVPAAGDNALAIATDLLDAGADPNSHWAYEWDGRPMVWSALCGVIGDGESGPVACPPHPQADALAELLLDRGAHVDQVQALYNTMLRGDDDPWLRMLIAHGLDAKAAWPGQSTDEDTTIFEYLLSHAVELDQVKRATVLLRNGARPIPTTGRSFYERAMLGGSIELADLLAHHGAPRVDLPERDRFRAVCMRCDEQARRLLAGNPSYLEEAAYLLVDEAAKRNLVPVAEFLLDLGVSADAEHNGPHGAYRALHQAACIDAAEVASVLIARGATVDARDTTNRATPLAWALRTHMPRTIVLLAKHSHDIFTLVAGSQQDRLRVLLAQDGELARRSTPSPLGLGLQGAAAGDTPLFVLPDDEDDALDIAQMLLASGADPGHRNHAGQTAADKARARGLHDVADLLVSTAAS